MDLVSGGSVLQRRRLSPPITTLDFPKPSVCPRRAFPFPKCSYPLAFSANISLTSHAKKRDTYAQPLPKQTTNGEEEEEERVEEEFMEDFEGGNYSMLAWFCSYSYLCLFMKTVQVLLPVGCMEAGVSCCFWLMKCCCFFVF